MVEKTIVVLDTGLKFHLFVDDNHHASARYNPWKGFNKVSGTDYSMILSKEQELVLAQRYVDTKQKEIDECQKAIDKAIERMKELASNE